MTPWYYTPTFTLIVIFSMLGFGLLFFPLGWFLRRRRTTEPHCPKCRYCLKGLARSTDGRFPPCPECGYTAKTERICFQRHARRGMVMMVIGAILFLPGATGSAIAGNLYWEWKREQNVIQPLIADGKIRFDVRTRSYHLEWLSACPLLPTAWTESLKSTPWAQRCVAINGCRKFSDADAVSLHELTRLRELRLEKTQLTANGLTHLTGVKNLIYINLSHTNITDQDLSRLTVLKELYWIDLSYTQVTDKGLAFLAANLEPSTRWFYLGLAHTQITNQSLTHLATVGLSGLNLSGTPITDDGLLLLTNQTGLDNLNLSDTKITDQGLKHLAGLSQLRSLDISNTTASDQGLHHLVVLPNLRNLTARNTRITQQGITSFRDASPSCAISN